MSYSIFIEKSARKELAEIPKPDRDKIAAAINELEEDPRPSGSKKLIGREAWRIRIGKAFIRSARNNGAQFLQDGQDLAPL